MQRLLRWLTYGALLLELRDLYLQVKDKVIDYELKRMCELASR